MKEKTETDLIKEYFDEITTVKALSLKWDREASEKWQNEKDAKDGAAAAERRRMEEEAKEVSR